MIYALIVVGIAVLAALLLRKPVIVASQRDIENAPANVERFSRALKQATNPAKKRELKANLKYWTRVQSAR